MKLQPPLSPEGVLTRVVDDVATVLAGRAGEAEGQVERAGIAAATIMEFKPRDAVEAIFASHCVVFHEMIVDGLRAMGGGEAGVTRQSTCGGIVALDRAFGANLTRLMRYRARQAAGVVDAKAQERAEEEIGDRVRRHRGAARVVEAVGAEARCPPETEPVAAEAPGDGRGPDDRMNSEGVEPFATSDEAEIGSVRSPDGTDEAWRKEAVERIAGLNRQARREFQRRARKHLSSIAARPALAGIDAAGAATRTG